MKEEECEGCEHHTTVGNVDWCQYYDRRTSNVVVCHYKGEKLK